MNDHSEQAVLDALRAAWCTVNPPYDPDEIGYICTEDKDVYRAFWSYHYQCWVIDEGDSYGDHVTAVVTHWQPALTPPPP